MARLTIFLGIICLALGLWSVVPIVRAYASNQIAWGRILDVVVIPRDDEKAWFITVFEYPVPGSNNHTFVQGTAQADARMALHELSDLSFGRVTAETHQTAIPLLPIAQAMAMRQSMLAFPRRRVFIPANIAASPPFIISEALAAGFGYRQGFFLALGGSLLTSMGLLALRRKE